MPDRTARPGRRCARAVLTLLRDGRTRPDEWDRRERSAVTRLHAWAFRHGADPWPAPSPGPAVARVQVDEDERGLRATGTLLAEDGDTFPGLPHGDEPFVDEGQRTPRPEPSEGAVDVDAYERQADSLRAEVARLSGLLDDASREAARADEAEATLALYRHRYGSRLEWTGEQLDRPADERARPIEEDPRRPHPTASDWPDDAVLLRYRELRRLVSLHLERYLDDPSPARAMLEGDVPLRLSEVLS